MTFLQGFGCEEIAVGDVERLQVSALDVDKVGGDQEVVGGTLPPLAL